MKKFILMLVITVMSVSMLAAATPAFTVDKFTLGNGVHAVIVKGELGNGGLICDKLPGCLPEINCPEQDTDAPLEDENVTPPADENDKPSDNEVIIPPQQDNDTPSDDTIVNPPSQDDDTPNTDSTMNEYEKEVVRLVNEIRVENGLKELVADEELSRVARIKSQDMKDNNYFSHTSPVYGSPFDMMKKFGISYKTAGENIAKGQTTPKAVVSGWMNSPGHRANILNASYNTIGVGYVAGGNYWTQMFVGR